MITSNVIQRIFRIEYEGCTAISNLDHNLNQECDTITVSLNRQETVSGTQIHH